MLNIAITGNMGSGKTTVSKVFYALGVPIFYADIEAKKILNDKHIISQIVELTNKSILTDNNLINNKILAKIIFDDKTILQKINKLIHPIVFNKFEEWKKLIQKTSYCIMESAIIFENKLEKKFDKIILVHCCEELKIKRIIERDNIDHQMINERLKNQIDSQFTLTQSDFVIYNDEKQSLLNQIIKIHKKIKNDK